jgi:outer membrane protein TolC
MKKRFWIISVGVTAFVAVVGSSVSAQQAQQPPPQLPLSSVAQMPPVDKYQVGTAKPPVVPGSPTIELSLDDAIAVALEKNLDLQVQKMTPAIQDYALVRLNANFRPTLTSSFTQNHAQTPSTNILDGVPTAITQSQNYSVGLNNNMRWQGATLGATFSSSRTASNLITKTNNPQFGTQMRFNYAQPLLAGRKIDSARNNLRTQEITRQITDINLAAIMENTKASVRTAYWALKQAIEQIEIANRSRGLAQQLLDNVKIQVQIGTSAGIETAQPEVAVAQADQVLLSANIAWQTAELALKRLLVNGKDDDLYRRTINPTELAILGGEPTVNIDGAVQTALANRTDIQVALKGIESSTLSLEVTKNATMPGLNVTAAYTLTGNGGPLVKNGIITTPGGYFDAVTGIAGNQSWNVGLNFTYPLGMQSARAAQSSAELSLEQSKAQLKVTELTVATDVTNAGLAVQNSYQSYLAAKKAREAQETATDAEQTKFNVGVSNSYNVVQQQNNLTAARLSELRALITYINAVADFGKKQRIGGGS